MTLQVKRACTTLVQIETICYIQAEANKIAMLELNDGFEELSNYQTVI